MPAPRIHVVAAVLIAVVSLVSPSRASADETTTETILFIRHGEKSPTGLGQLSCRGLNRALALPAVLGARFKRIDAVFAPDPSHQKPDGELSFDYVRPLATIEPTAIRFGLPVHAAIGYAETDKLRDALLVPELRKDVVLVAWEHHAMNKLVPALVADLGGDAKRVPDWQRSDFDSLWQVTIVWTGAKAVATFAAGRQNLDGLPETCPEAATRDRAETPLTPDR